MIGDLWTYMGVGRSDEIASPAHLLAMSVIRQRADIGDGPDPGAWLRLIFRRGRHQKETAKRHHGREPLPRKIYRHLFCSCLENPCARSTAPIQSAWPPGDWECGSASSQL
jgi:hypothetical protein